MMVQNCSGVGLPIMPRSELVMLPEQPVYLAGYAYLKNEFANARLYQAGILSDQDPEFLHQYRVCLRRTRAVISLLKGGVPASEKKWLSTGLKELMQKTNLLRDLDVYLLKRETFYKLLKPEHHSGLSLFFDDIELRRTTALDNLRGWLHSTSYQKQCKVIESLLQRPKQGISAQPADISCAIYARKAVWKRFKKVRGRAGKIDLQSEDAEIHQLRIDCKKLRYLLEVFAPVFTNSVFQRELNTLKQLQNYLGDHNDKAVQHAFLSHYLQQQKEKNSCYKALHNLLRISHKLQQQARADALQQLDNFLLPQTKADYQILCR